MPSTKAPAYAHWSASSSSMRMSWLYISWSGPSSLPKKIQKNRTSTLIHEQSLGRQHVLNLLAIAMSTFPTRRCSKYLPYLLSPSQSPCLTQNTKSWQAALLLSNCVLQGYQHIVDLWSVWIVFTEARVGFSELFYINHCFDSFSSSTATSAALLFTPGLPLQTDRNQGTLPRAPVLIWPVKSPTAKSAITVSCMPWS